MPGVTPARELQHTVGNVSVRMLRAGAGEPLLFLHGAGGWPGRLPLFEKLAAHYDVLVPEHPGFGTLENAGAIRDVADMAMYYLDFLDGLDADRVHVVGNSLGGWIAAEVAVRNSSRVQTLALISPAGVRVKGVPMGDNFIWSPEEAARNLFYDQSYADRMLAQAQAPSEEDADRALTNRFMAAKLGWEPARSPAGQPQVFACSRVAQGPGASLTPGGSGLGTRVSTRRPFLRPDEAPR